MNSLLYSRAAPKSTSWIWGRGVRTTIDPVNGRTSRLLAQAMKMLAQGKETNLILLLIPQEVAPIRVRLHRAPGEELAEAELDDAGGDLGRG